VNCGGNGQKKKQPLGIHITIFAAHRSGGVAAVGGPVEGRRERHDRARVGLAGATSLVQTHRWLGGVWVKGVWGRANYLVAIRWNGVAWAAMERESDDNGGGARRGDGRRTSI